MIWLFVTKVTFNTRGGPTSTEKVDAHKKGILIYKFKKSEINSMYSL